jgi:hypothetical protein
MDLMDKNSFTCPQRKKPQTFAVVANLDDALALGSRI